MKNVREDARRLLAPLAQEPANGDLDDLAPGLDTEDLTPVKAVADDSEAPVLVTRELPAARAERGATTLNGRRPLREVPKIVDGNDQRP